MRIPIPFMILPSRATSPNSTTAEFGIKFRDLEETYIFQEPAETL